MCPCCPAVPGMCFPFGILCPSRAAFGRGDKPPVLGLGKKRGSLVLAGPSCLCRGRNAELLITPTSRGALPVPRPRQLLALPFGPGWVFIARGSSLPAPWGREDSSRVCVWVWSCWEEAGMAPGAVASHFSRPLCPRENPLQEKICAGPPQSQGRGVSCACLSLGWLATHPSVPLEQLPALPQLPPSPPETRIVIFSWISHLGARPRRWGVSRAGLF